MARAWADINIRLDRFLDDALRTDAAGDPRDRLFPVPLRVDAWNWAQDVLVHHTPLAKSMTLVVNEGQREAVLPDDFFAVSRIYDSDQERFWRPAHFAPGDIRYADEELPEYWVMGNKLYIEDTLEYDQEDLTLYYWAYYPPVECTYTDNEITTTPQGVVRTPRWAELALVHLTTATCLMPMEIFAADLNQYKIRVESGTPLHNPRAQSANFHYQWWNMLMDRVPPAYKDTYG